ncbi:MAG: hypothetical protein CME80_04155 [Halomonas sp.]|nr:hypothetical protein [Halomonas sp.]
MADLSKVVDSASVTANKGSAEGLSFAHGDQSVIFLQNRLPTRQRNRKVRIRCRGRQASPAVNEV